VDVSLPIPLDIDSEEVGNDPFNSDLELCHLHVFYHLQKLSALWASEDGIIGIKDVDAVFPDKDAWTGGQLNEANAFELLDQVQEPDRTSLFLAVNVPQNLQDVIPFCINFAAFGDLHVHVVLNQCLEVSQDVVNLEGLPAIYDS